MLWDGTYGFLSLIYPWGLESLTVCRCDNKTAVSFSVILRPSMLVRPGFETCDLLLTRPTGALPAELTRRRSVETSSLWKISLGCFCKCQSSIYDAYCKLHHCYTSYNDYLITCSRLERLSRKLKRNSWQVAKKCVEMNSPIVHWLKTSWKARETHRKVKTLLRN